MATNFYLSELSSQDKAKFLSIAGGLNRDKQQNKTQNSFVGNRDAILKLRERLKVMEAEKDELEGSNGHLKRELGLAQEEAKDLKSELETLRNVHERTVQDNRKTVDRMQLERSAESLKSADAISNLEAKLANLEEYELLKQEFEATIADLKEQLRQQTQDSLEKQQALEQKVQDTMENGERRRRKDIQVVREEMEAKLEHMLDATTRTTITENSRMTTELQYLSHRVTQLLHNNKRLTKKNKYLTRELSSSVEMSNETTKRVRFYQRMYEQMKKASEIEMTAKLEEQESARVELLQKAQKSSGSNTVGHQPGSSNTREYTAALEEEFFDTEKSEDVRDVSLALNELTTLLEDRLNKGQSEVQFCRGKNEELYHRAGRGLRVSSSAELLAATPHRPGMNTGTSKYAKWESNILPAGKSVPV
jgi:hypothetical protein